jgi:hypothetical protein
MDPENRKKTVIAQRIINETLTAPSSPAVEKTAVLCWLQLTELMSLLWAG